MLADPVLPSLQFTAAGTRITEASAMSSPSSLTVHGSPTRVWDAAASSGLAAGIVVAVLVRILFFTGFFGSDEVTYTDVASAIARSDWKVSDYVGTLRYGVNLPNALFMTLFGASEFSANLWSLLCSVGEVALVYVLSYLLWGLRAALLCAALIIFLPLHVHFAGRLMADAPLAFFITLSFVLFWIAEKRQAAIWYFATGLAAGLVFWIKEVVIIYCVAFVAYALIRRTWRAKWLWIGLGGTVAVGANCALFWVIAGDPLYIYHVVRKTTAMYVASREHIESSPWYYFRYLFVDIRHTWLMPFLAVGGVLIWARGAIPARFIDSDTGYVVVWGLSLLALFSLAPISLSPLTFIAKQTNYMLIFMAPLCLLAGYFLASLPRGWMLTVMGAYVAGGVILSGLEQQAIRVFTANSKATVAFARDHTDFPVYAMTNAHRAGKYAELLQRPAAGNLPIRSISELFSEPAADARSDAPTFRAGYAVVDLETMSWGKHEPIREISDVPPCWRRRATLDPAPELGPGYYIASRMLSAAQLLPASLNKRLVPPLDALIHSKPAYVYFVPAGCSSTADASEAR